MRRRMIWGESQPLTFVALEDATFSFTNNVEYKIGNDAWQTLSAGESTPTVPQGKKIKWRGKLTNPVIDVGIGTFSSTGRYNAEGNPLSLVLYNKFVGVRVMPNKIYLFCRLFYQDTNLVSTKNLKLICNNLRQYCYKETFRECTSLVESCDLPAEVASVRSYDSMYYGCTSLIKAPYIGLLYVAAEGICYQMFYGCNNLKSIERIPNGGNIRYTHSYMFYNCSSLEYIPQVTLALRHSCNQSMFQECTSLVDASNITFKQFAGQEDVSCCAYMFNGCTSLVIPPKEIRLDNPINYSQFRGMFLGCTSLTKSPDLYIPKLPTLCFYQMFDGCSSLQRIKCLATDMTGSNCLQNWVRGVSSTGTFIKHPDATWVTGASGIPSGWTIEEE